MKKILLIAIYTYIIIGIYNYILSYNIKINLINETNAGAILEVNTFGYNFNYYMDK